MKHSNFVIKGVEICAAEITAGTAEDGAGVVTVIRAGAVAAAAAGPAGGNRRDRTGRMRPRRCALL